MPPPPPGTLELLFRAIVNNKIEDVGSLCRKFGKDLVNQSDKYGRTPLWIAADCSSTTATGFLLKYGANPMTADVWKLTPLHQAAIRNNANIVSQLIEAIPDKGARTAYVNQTDATEESALFVSAGENNHQIALILTKAKANIALQNSQGDTPLHRIKDIRMADILLKNIYPEDMRRALSIKNIDDKTAAETVTEPNVSAYLKNIKENIFLKLQQKQFKKRSEKKDSVPPSALLVTGMFATRPTSPSIARGGSDRDLVGRVALLLQRRV